MTAHVCPPEHGHGTSGTCYKTHGCRCFPCRVNHANYQDRRNRAIAYGRWDTGLVDAEPVRQHLRYLSGFGIGYKQAAILAGVSRSTLTQVLRGRNHDGYAQNRVNRRTAEAVLQLRPNLDGVADGQNVPARGAHRRVQALVALGWTIPTIAREIGWTTANLHGLLTKDQVTAATHRKIAALYEQWSGRKPTPVGRWAIAAHTRALRTAEANGWVPPLAWDDIDQDVEPPVADEDVIDELAIDHAVAGHHMTLTRPERIAAVVRLTAAGLSANEVAEQLHTNDRQVARDLFDHRNRQEASA